MRGSAQTLPRPVSKREVAAILTVTDAPPGGVVIDFSATYSGAGSVVDFTWTDAPGSTNTQLLAKLSGGWQVVADKVVSPSEAKLPAGSWSFAVRCLVDGAWTYSNTDTATVPGVMGVSGQTVPAVCSTMPPASATKQELIDWLEQTPEPGFTIPNPASLSKAELKQMVASYCSVP